jgi:hypothetical protein
MAKSLESRTPSRDGPSVRIPSAPPCKRLKLFTFRLTENGAHPAAISEHRRNPALAVVRNACGSFAGRSSVAGPTTERGRRNFCQNFCHPSSSLGRWASFKRHRNFPLALRRTHCGSADTAGRSFEGFQIHLRSPQSYATHREAEEEADIAMWKFLLRHWR